MKQKEGLEDLQRARSLTFSPSTTEPETITVPTISTETVKELNPVILSSSPLCVDAPEFRPRARTVPAPLSQSLPTNVPSDPSHYKRVRRGGRGRKDLKAAPRFFPAISKENISDKVSQMEIFKSGMLLVALDHH